MNSNTNLHIRPPAAAAARTHGCMPMHWPNRLQAACTLKVRACSPNFEGLRSRDGNKMHVMNPGCMPGEPGEQRSCRTPGQMIEKPVGSYSCYVGFTALATLSNKNGRVRPMPPQLCAHTSLQLHTTRLWRAGRHPQSHLEQERAHAMD